MQPIDSKSGQDISVLWALLFLTRLGSKLITRADSHNIGLLMALAGSGTIPHRENQISELMLVYGSGSSRDA